MIFIVGEETTQLRAGDFLNVEKGEKHTFRNESESAAGLIVTFVPAGIKNMFIELESDENNMVAIGQKYGTDFQVGR